MIGFCQTAIDDYGVAKNQETVRPYYGDIVHRSQKWDSAQQLIDNVSLNMQISVVADEYATRNFNNIRYVEFKGAKWKVLSVEPQYPRMILQMGGVYNG